MVTTASIIRQRRRVNDGSKSKATKNYSSLRTCDEDYCGDPRGIKLISRFSSAGPCPDFSSRPSSSSSLPKGLSRLFRSMKKPPPLLSPCVSSSSPIRNAHDSPCLSRSSHQSTPSPTRGGSASDLSSVALTPAPREPSFFSTNSSIEGIAYHESSPDDDTCSILSAVESEHSSIFEEAAVNLQEGGSSSSKTSTVEHFKKRENLCARIISGKPASYQEMIIANEMACREKTRPLGTVACSRNEFLMPNKLPSRSMSSPLRRLRRLMLFEYHHSFEGGWSVLWYCIGHFSLFSLVDALATLVLRVSGLSPYTFHGLLMLFSICIMRVNGYLWSWLCPESRRVVKFDFHNRAVLGFWDARILAVLRRPPFSSLNRVLSMISFYIFYNGAQFYYSEVSDCWEKIFWLYQQMLEKQVVGVVEVPPETLPCDAFLFLEKSTLANRFAHYFCVNCEGDPESVIPMVLLYFLGAFVASLMMARSGGTIFEL